MYAYLGLVVLLLILGIIIVHFIDERDSKIKQCKHACFACKYKYVCDWYTNNH